MSVGTPYQIIHVGGYPLANNSCRWVGLCSVCPCVHAHSETVVTDTYAHSIVTAAQCATVVFYSLWHSVNVSVTCICVYTRSSTVTENLIHRGDYDAVCECVTV